MPEIVLVDPKEIRPREMLRLPRVAKDFAKRMRRGGWPAEIPPLVVTTRWRLIDGHHRHAAALKAKLRAVPACVLDHEEFFWRFDDTDISALTLAREMGCAIPRNRTSPPELRLARQVGDIVRGWTLRRESYVLLDQLVPGASDWGSGGCGLLALALRSLIDDARLYVIRQFGDPAVQHVLVDWSGQLIDYRGASLQGARLESFEREWHLPRESARLSPAGSFADWADGATEIEIGPEAVHRVATVLRPLLAKVLPEVD